MADGGNLDINRVSSRVREHKKSDKMMAAERVDWFTLDTKDLGYTNIMGAARSGEEVVSGLYASSFSSVSLPFYVGVIICILLFCYLLMGCSRRLNYRLGSSSKVALLLFVVFFVYVSFFITMLWGVPFGGVPEKLREGTFGDSFGTLNALFSGLAFSGVLITMFLQRKDLIESRAQVSNQQIESQFYNMLALQQSVVSGFDLKKKGELLYSGRDCFKAWHRFFETEFRESISPEYRKLDDAYELMWLKYQGDLSLYFRSLYSVFRFISESGHPDAPKFGGIVRSFLSDFELVVLYYNCLSAQGNGFKKYISEFKVFDNLDTNMLIDVGELDRFDARSFGANEAALYMRAIVGEAAKT